MVKEYNFLNLKKWTNSFWNGIVIIITLFYSQMAIANASQPGIWNAGGTVFTMLFPEDSSTFKKVQMQEERIYMQLYKGYAVVKGTYRFRNTTQENLNFKMGYPVNGIYYGGAIDLNRVNLDSLSSFKIKTNGNWLTLLKETHPELNNDYKNPVPSDDNWMVWEMNFAPQESQTVEVYFIVNTNEASVQRGYNIEKRNAFIYLLESGSVWHQPIEKGHFYIQLMNSLTFKNIQGISQGFGFQYHEKNRILFGAKTNFSPTPKDNLVVTYFEHNPKFDFNKVILQTETLFSKIDELSKLSFENLNYKPIELGDPYEVKSTWLGYFPLALTYIAIYGPIILGFILLFIILRIIYKRLKKRKQSGNK